MIKKMADIDGVSGATASWIEGKGTPIDYEHKEPTRQALEDFRTSIVEDKIPLSNFKSGAKTSFAVAMGIKAVSYTNLRAHETREDRVSRSKG